MDAGTIELNVDGDEVSGEFALDMAPGTVAAERDKKIFAVLSEPLNEVARELGLVLTADPYRYARQEPGKLPDGTTRFTVKARREGDRLLPALRGQKYK